jgi:peptidylprolyl isomerase
MLPLKGLTCMRILTMLALTLLTIAPLMAQTPPQQSVATPPPDVKAPPADAAKTASGLASRVVKAGTGKTHPGKSDLVTVHYTGWKTDGAMFDSSVLRGKPATFPLDRVIAGWTEGVQMMVEGEKRRFDPGGLGRWREHGMLVFDVELISFMPSPANSPRREGGADDAANASGLAYKVQRPGTGARHPSERSMVTVHYSGWTTDGKLFDSSVTRGQPASFPLNGVIKGWTEGVQLMVEGEKTRFWIPEALAYQGRSAPFGMLVFDVELIKIN